MGMSDDQTPQPPAPPRPVRKRPANVNQRAEIRARPKPRVQQSKESKFVGYVVLGFGLLAVLAVAVIALGGGDNAEKVDTATARDPAYNFGRPTQNPAPPAPTNLNARAAQDLAANLPPVQAPPPLRAKGELFFARQPKLDARAIEGTWQAVVGKYTAVLQIGAGRYQVVLANPYEYGYRLYSAGTYNKTEDILRLTPQNSWPVPNTPAGMPISYSKITTAPFPVIAAVDQGRMFWQNPPRSEKRVLVPNTLPLLVGEPQDYIAWQKLPAR